MNWRRHLTRRRLLALSAAFVILYGGLWYLTDRIGTAQVRAFAVETMHIPSNDADDTHAGRRTPGPGYVCLSRAYGPFVVRADYGRHGGPLSGDGGSAVYLWFFGHIGRIRELDRWAE